MGKETSTLSNHNLNTNSIEELAEDLSQRLKSTVTYGYFKDFDFEYEKKYGSVNYDDFVFVKQGKVKYPGSKRKLTLSEYDFCYRNFIKEYGKEILNDEFFKTDSYYSEAILNAEKTLNYELYENDDYLVDINKHSFINWSGYDISWWSYCQNFITKKDEFRDDYIQKWRKQVSEVIKIYGGTEVIVACFETKSNDIVEYANELNGWEEIKTEAKRKFKNKLLNISNFYLKNLADDLPENEMEAINLIYDKQNFLEANKENFNKIEQIKSMYYDIYFDDFKDLYK